MIISKSPIVDFVGDLLMRSEINCIGSVHLDELPRFLRPSNQNRYQNSVEASRRVSLVCSTSLSRAEDLPYRKTFVRFGCQSNFNLQPRFYDEALRSEDKQAPV
jgi:hypothetical protein